MDHRSLRALDELSESGELPPINPGWPGKSVATARLAPRTVLLRAVDGGAVGLGAEALVERASSSSGAPLPDPVRERFEGSLGAALDGVRVHTGPASAAAAQAVGAHAYTVGRDIHFAEGRYQPDDPFGLHLLAHEVAHTVQQDGTAPRRQHKLEVSGPGDAAEVEADRAADAMVAGRPATVGSAPAITHRKPDGKGGKGDGKAKSGFKPEIEVTPQLVLADFNDTVELKSSVTNSAKAPSGTTFEFDWSVSPQHHIAVTGPAKGQTFKGLTKVSGTADVKPGVTVHEPGGDLEDDLMWNSHAGKPAKVDVATPKVTWKTTMTGKGTGPGDMRQGDTCRVESEFEDVQEPMKVTKASARLGVESLGMRWNDVPASIRPAGARNDEEALSMKTITAPDKFVFEVKAARAGQGTLAIAGKCGPVSIDQPIVFKVSATADQFLSRCSTALARHTSLTSVVSAWGSQQAQAYKTAYDTFKGVLADRAATQRLADDILWSILFVGVGGLAGGAVGGALKGPIESLTKSNLARGALTDAPKDLAKFTARLPQQFVRGGAPAAAGGKGTAPKDPFSWHLDLAAANALESAAVSEQIKQWMDAAQAAVDAGSDAAFEFDPVDAVNQATTIAGVRVDGLTAVATADHYERNLWTAWLRQYAYERVRDPNGSGAAVDRRGDDVKQHVQAIEKRLKELGIDPGWGDQAAEESKAEASKGKSVTEPPPADAPIEKRERTPWR